MRLSPSVRLLSGAAVAPMLGVALLVPAIVLLSAASSYDRGLRLDLPPAGEGAPSPWTGEHVLVRVLDDSSLLVDGNAVPLGDLAERVRSALAGCPGAPVVVYGSGDASYGAVVTAIDALRDAGHWADDEAPALYVPTHSEIRQAARLLGVDPFAAAREAR